MYLHNKHPPNLSSQIKDLFFLPRNKRTQNFELLQSREQPRCGFPISLDLRCWWADWRGDS